MPETYVTPEQVDAMLRTVNNQRDFLLIRLLFRLGCRISELLPLTVSQIDFKNNIVALQLLKQRLKLSCPHCDSRLSRSSKFCQVCGQAVQETVQKASEVKTMRRLPLGGETMAMLRRFLEGGGPKGGVVAYSLSATGWQPTAWLRQLLVLAFLTSGGNGLKVSQTRRNRIPPPQVICSPMTAS